MASDIETDNQVQPMDTLCSAYNELLPLLTNPPAEHETCGLAGGGGYFGSCSCGNVYKCNKFLRRCEKDEHYGSLSKSDCEKECGGDDDEVAVGHEAQQPPQQQPPQQQPPQQQQQVVESSAAPQLTRSTGQLAARTLGMYVLVADDTDKVYTSTHEWTPQLHPYQQQGADVLYLTFLNPALMPSVPPAFAALAKSRGTGAAGAVPSGTTIIFAIGGEAYSTKPNPWDWLTTQAKAEAMAAEVAQWPKKYGCDGIDLDIETGAGAAKGAGANLVHFVAKLKELAPKMVVTQPVFGSPSSVPAANAMLEAAYNHSLASPAFGAVSKVGIMIYSGVGAETYLDNYEHGCDKHCSQWYCPLAACVPAANMVLGAGGASSATTIATLADDVVSKGLGGIMVWYASLIDKATGKAALQYGSDGDASGGALDAWAKALKRMQA